MIEQTEKSPPLTFKLLTRREFLILSSFFLVGGGLGFGLHKKSPWLFSDGGFDILENNSSPTHNPLPSQLRGFYANAPTLYQKPDQWERAFEKAKELGVRRLRIFLNDAFEPEIGKYNDDLLLLIARFSRQWSDFQEGAGIELDLFDCFSLGNQLLWNGVYETQLKPSPYNPSLTYPGYRDFFEKKKLREAFINRVVYALTKLVNELGVRNLAAISVANEPNLRLIGGETKENVALLTDWYKEILPVISEIAPGIPILPGVAEPWFINFRELPWLCANTFHAYPFGIDLERLSQYVRGEIPLVCQEIGFPSRFLGITIPENKKDMWMARFINHVVVSTTIQTPQKTILYCGSIGVWKIEDYDDGFEIKNIPPQLLKYYAKN